MSNDPLCPFTRAHREQLEPSFGNQPKSDSFPRTLEDLERMIRLAAEKKKQEQRK